MSDRNSTSFFSRLKRAIIGEARDVRDPGLFRKLSLAALLAWIGLGGDGLSSSAYGPEEAFRVLGGHTFLGIFVALATAVTIFVITAGYSQIVELFPGGGGGYLVASKLLSPSLGMISGSALLIDYILTITLSIASGADAIFSFLPSGWLPYKLVLAVAGVAGLTILNLRGVRESVMPLVPVFLLFLATHIFAILYALFSNGATFMAMSGTASADIGRATGELGAFGVFILILRSYSMGAGTYTGIEAVSNGMPILREPRVQTARRTMRYMAGSLAFMAVGLMIGYLLYNVGPVNGKTFNAVLFEKMTLGWGIPGYVFVLITLISEAVLLFVAAQTGFLGGPRILANMSMDRWLPQQFSLLSERLVIKNGIFLMGGASVVLMLASRGSVQLLVVLYAINVFITFCLSQSGMVRHWWRGRKKIKTWRRKLFVNGVGLILCGFILVSQIVLKFGQGGWITILITGSVAFIAVVIKRFYTRTFKKLKRLDHLMEAAVAPAPDSEVEEEKKKHAPRFQPKAKTAVLLVSGFNGMGFHTLLNVIKVFGGTFRNFIFMQTGIIDADRFKGADDLEKLSAHVQDGLSRYVEFARSQGHHAEAVSAIGTDIADEITTLAQKIFKRNPNSVFFGGQIVFAEETFLSRVLYNHTTFAVQRRLHREGIPFIIMPIRMK
jgi:amino acid transporter